MYGKDSNLSICNLVNVIRIVVVYLYMKTILEEWFLYLIQEFYQSIHG